MSNIIDNLQKTFDGELMQFGAINNIKVCLENVDAPTSSDTPYISSFLLDGDMESADLSANDSISSIYQIDVNYTSHSGRSSVNKMIDKLRVAFPIGSYHSFGGDCFGVDLLTITPLPVSGGWAKKSISLNVSGFTPVI